MSFQLCQMDASSDLSGRSVAIVGGGFAGVSAAAELEARYPGQGLTLVHVRAQLEQLLDTCRGKLGYTVDRRAQVELKSERV